MAKQTPLYPVHAASGAKIVDFAGWDMPIHYGSQLEEHKTVRADAGMFDVSHMLPIDVCGAGAQAFLSILLANNVAKLSEEGRALYSCMLQEDGGVIDDLIVYFFAQDDYRIVVNAGTADKDVAWMREQASKLHGGNVTINPRRDLAIIAVQGPNAQAKVWAALPGTEAAASHLKYFQAARMDELMVCFTGYTGEAGYELIFPAGRAIEVWNALAAQGVAPIGLGARDTLRLEAGMNLYGQDMDESVGPLESGLAWTVDFSGERAFIGRAALEAKAPARQLVGLLLEDRGVLRSHTPVFTAHGEGETTSGSFAPSMNASIAFARVPAGVEVGDKVEVEIRGKRLAARVVKLPFVRRGKVLV
ncbi:glycine cleavage system aminomethyltransferase GcvT [Uliginosibacterium aquaticum]|uniref:Aminomethyltransferase n=1 Tax=Uliginosibacterium aquaticum TaxID=2731212 RepID=A0ABX2IG83_9RHOO|nr:glycine cleavage system aminomethyltransferase GcvT [Uliginosibacterium aquaticum]NSL55252.1 glycine cleavage system aminomethyltransferase GcvT [Uliginosibacterium aquaticum]